MCWGWGGGGGGGQPRHKATIGKGGFFIMLVCVLGVGGGGEEVNRGTKRRLVRGDFLFQTLALV